jgi:AcrR family transcriptional regulator
MRRYHHGNLRAALIEAALSLLAEGGPAVLSLREVARRAGVSHAAPYRHFDDRAALLSALAEHAFVELEQRLVASDRSLEALGRAYLEFALDHPERFRLMFDGEARSQSVDRAAERALTLLRTARGDGAWSAVHGVAVLAAERWLDRERAASLLAER